MMKTYRSDINIELFVFNHVEQLSDILINNRRIPLTLKYHDESITTLTGTFETAIREENVKSDF